MIRKRADRAGFTLIELMVAVAILGLGMTIVFLKVDTLLPGSRLTAACKKVVTDIELLRSHSIFTGTPVYFEYDVQLNTYRAYSPVTFDDDGRVMGAGETEIMEPAFLGELIAIDRVAVGYQDDGEGSSDMRQTICIRPDGSLTGHIVHMTNTDSGQLMSIRIASLTGFAEVFDGHIEYEEVTDASF